VNAVRLVARRELRERLRARTFRVGTILSAAVVIMAIAIPAARRGQTPTYDVGVVDPPESEIGAIAGVAENLGIRIRIREMDDVTEARRRVRSGNLDAVVVGTDEILTNRIPDEGDGGKKAQLLTALGANVRVQRVLKQFGPDAVEALRALQEPVKVSGVARQSNNLRERVTAYFGVFLLFLFIQQYSAWVLIGVVEEKSSRVVEVLLSAIRPRQLVAGKVLGIGAAALLQAIIVAAAALVTAEATGTHVFEGTSRYAIAWGLAWFVLGYGLFSWMYAAVGSLVSRQAEAQNVSFPLSVPLLISFFAANSLLTGGEPTAFHRVLSFIPLTSPLVMPMLIGLGRVVWWQILIAIGLSVGAIGFLFVAAGDIYARASLHSGRRLRLREVVRREFTAA
jgi:ABC-2 type transport system permease protein